MIELNSKIKDGLIKMDFIKRYEKLSGQFNLEKIPRENWLRNINVKEVMEIIRKLGYSPKYDYKEKFFKIEEEQIGQFTFGMHMILKLGIADLVWVVRENGELLLGDPWSVYSRRLIDVNYRIKYPQFGTYEDLEEILKVSFEMYEDFKRVLINC